MEWLKKLIEAAKIADGKLDVDALMTAINAEFPKNAVPKDKYNDISGQLKTANDTITDLKKNNKDNETLQNTIKTHEKTISDLKTDSLKREKEFKFKGALEKAGATDPDYLLYKLGGVDKLEMDAEGNITDQDNKIKDLQANNASFFKAEEGDNTNNTKILENKLKDGDKGTGDDVASIFANALNGNF